MPPVEIPRRSSSGSRSSVRNGVIQPELTEPHPVDIAGADGLSHRSCIEPVHVTSWAHPSVTCNRARSHSELWLGSRLITPDLSIHGVPSRLLLLLLLLLLLSRTLIRHSTRQAHSVRCGLIRLIRPHRPIPARVESIPRGAPWITHPCPWCRSRGRVRSTRSHDTLHRQMTGPGTARRSERFEMRFTSSLAALRRTRTSSGRGRRR